MTDSIDINKYTKQLALPGMNPTAQERLGNAHVVLLGLGGSGTACATYLAAAGVGSLTLVDQAVLRNEDITECPLFRTADAGSLKVTTASQNLLAINPDIKISEVTNRLDAHNAEEIVEHAHLVIDGLSNWQDKLIVSDVCMQMGKTLVHAGLRGFEFHVYTMIPGRSACLRCVFSKVGLEDIASIAHKQRGVLGPVAGMAGSFQAIEAIKILAGIGPTPGNHLIKFDSLRRDFDDVTDLGPRPDCPDCGMRF